ncbi:MAG: alcohol dehydrogenase catalytic domain-containing protein [Candidatus Coatesbacteria bacterium]|nr:MAG: alcohol dehydrogenase catalytic domain-containing protein [Candidatus Coatesbacteria bacterium]
MKAVVLTSGKLSAREDYPKPAPERDEAVVKVTLAGVCDTDVQLAGGYLSFEGVPGHEFVGVVEAGSADWLGQRVVGEINCPCGVCERCLAGRGNHCAYRTVLGIDGRDGAFAEYLLLPTANLHVVPAGLPEEKAVFTEPLAAAVNVVELTHVAPTDQVAVVGDGKLGLLVAQVVSLTGAAVVVAGHHPGRAEKLARMGRTLPLLAPADVPANHFDVVVECTGAADGLDHALRYVRPAGVVVLKTTLADPYNVDLAAAVVDEIAIVGNRCGPFTPALHLLQEGLVDPTPLVEETHAVEDLPDLLARGAPGLKHLIRL